jgi:quercetin dioxygenase-like cupin family protein
MNSNVREHNQEHLDLVFLYVLQALPSSDIQPVEAQIYGCAECRREMETLRPIVASFVSWPTDVLRPAESLWGRLARRIAKETGAEPFLPPPQSAAKPEWEQAAPGIDVKLLATHTMKKRVSMLVRLAPGTDYPPHRHAGIEELYLLQGELMIDDKKVYPGDYIRAEADSIDHRVWSETGCTCVLLTSTEDEILH